MPAMQIIRAELAASCDALMLGKPLPVPPVLEAEYADFARWEQAQGDDDAALSWWTDHLDGVPALINLPTTTRGRWSKQRSQGMWTLRRR